MNEDEFLAALVHLRTSGHEDLTSVDARFKASLLSYGSETEDNLSCVEEIKYAGFTQDESISGRGLALKASGYFVSDIVHFVEGTPIPDAVKQEFPLLSPKEMGRSDEIGHFDSFGNRKLGSKS